MSITTPVTDLLGINHPILLAPMDGVADARLVAAVDAAGGFGILGVRFQREIPHNRGGRYASDSVRQSVLAGRHKVRVRLIAFLAVLALLAFSVGLLWWAFT